jgi:hypothetical protein
VDVAANMNAPPQESNFNTAPQDGQDTQDGQD